VLFGSEDANSNVDGISYRCDLITVMNTVIVWFAHHPFRKRCLATPAERSSSSAPRCVALVRTRISPCGLPASSSCFWLSLSLCLPWLAQLLDARRTRRPVGASDGASSIKSSARKKNPDGIWFTSCWGVNVFELDGI
jgi:hypothetical protein